MEMTRSNALRWMSACVCVLAGAALEARTVALWPLEYDHAAGANGGNGGKCAIDSANDFVVSNAVWHGDAVIDGPGWNLPPNPDTTANMRFSPTNHTSMGTTRAVTWFLQNDTIAGRYLKPTQEFTLEGWIKFNGFPKNYLTCIANAFGSGGNDNRFLFTLRNNNGGYTSTTNPEDTEWISFQLWANRPAIGEYVLWKPKGADLVALTNAWHHFALSHTPNSPQGKMEWKFYWDGELKGSYVGDAWNGDETTSSTDNTLHLGTRLASSGVSTYLDYCRLSDTVLEPEDFLCASGTGPVVLSKDDPTLVYWPLGRNADGTIDGSPLEGYPFIGGGRLDAGTEAGADALTRPFVVDPDQAFTGNVPNTATSIKSSTDNKGCLMSPIRIDNMCMAIKELGKQLTLTNDFTVEGWYKFEVRDPSKKYNTWTIIAGSKAGGPGWLLEKYYNPLNDKVYFSMHSQLNNATYIHGSSAPNFGSFLNTEHVWRHLALVYDCDGGEGGRGLWKFYVDGNLSGTCTHTQDVPSGLTYESYFCLGASAKSQSAQNGTGKFDHWRVCRAALEPDQFLCATNGARDATDVLAYWPMDAQRGVYIDGTDLTGNYTFENPRDNKYLAEAVDDTPPQVGLPANNGSVSFYGGSAGDYPYLFTSDANVCDLFSLNGWTFESWVKLTTEASHWGIIFFSSGNTHSSLSVNPNSGLNFTYRTSGQSTKGFVFYSPIIKTKADTEFHDSSGNPIYLPLNVWTHVAFSFTNDNDTCTYTLYTNGVKVSTVTDDFDRYPSIKCVMFGGRPNSSNPFRGRIAGMRFSKSALQPGEFLCDRVAPAASTCAYWPLDYASGAFNLSAYLGGYMADYNMIGISGLERGARGRVPNPDTTPGATGSLTANSGAVSLGSGGRLGADLSYGAEFLDGPFTVEGWYKWANAAGAVRETLVGNHDTATLGGWRLMIDSTESPARFRLLGRLKYPGTVYVDGMFDAGAAAFDGEWHHLALSHDPSAKPTGVWTLMIDGVAAGSVTNIWRPQRAGLGDDVIRLGAASGEKGTVSFIGELDMWRISRGVLDAQSLLYRRPPGSVFIVR
ncbi:MAG: hypothetical protein IKO72_02570 [Kiritimatiellae bacterium]|nr:hypothetical protein [Kiritimatiellia bacterium]